MKKNVLFAIVSIVMFGCGTKIEPGSVAPDFSCSDINGEIFTMESFKGKVVYIDVWATWCGPCNNEIPHLQALEADLHEEPIAFVSISVDDEKQDWEKIVKDKKLGGYQLFATGGWESDIVTNYGISGIPRFIIIDKEGKVVDSNASRPSNSKTKGILLELAKK